MPGTFRKRADNTDSTQTDEGFGNQGLGPRCGSRRVCRTRCGPGADAPVLDRYAARNENVVLVVARVMRGRLAVLGAPSRYWQTSQAAVRHRDIKGQSPWLVHAQQNRGFGGRCTPASSGGLSRVLVSAAFGEVAERSIAADCKSAALVATEVRTLPSPPSFAHECWRRMPTIARSAKVGQTGDRTSFGWRASLCT